MSRRDASATWCAVVSGARSCLLESATVEKVTKSWDRKWTRDWRVPFLPAVVEMRLSSSKVAVTFLDVKDLA